MNDDRTERIEPGRLGRGRPDDEVTVWRPDGVHPPPPSRQGDVPPAGQRMPPTLQGRPPAPAPAASRGEGTTLILAAAVLILVSVALGVYGRTHQATFFAFNLAGFSSGTAAKAWLATVSFLLAIVQLVSALVMYGKLPLRAPSWIGGLHRWSGRIAVLVSVPVAVHCLYALGFQTGQARVLFHSIFGCLFYGAFVAKMLVLQRKASPGWLLPVLGGVVFAGLTVLWLTAAAWFFGTKGITL